MIDHAYAKINLWLSILERTSSGYHRLESAVAFANVYDTLSFEEAGTLSLSITHTIAQQKAPELKDNLIYHVCQLFEDHYKIPVLGHFHLEKRLPFGAGIGSGSADGACAARLLLKHYKQTATDGFLEGLSDLGKDLPMCFYSQSSYIEGFGEKITPLKGFKAPILLIWPGVSLSTPQVFQNGIFKKRPPSQRPLSLSLDLIEEKDNDLTKSAQQLCPEIFDALKALKPHNPELSRMSGSGSCCFALFKKSSQCFEAAQFIKENNPHWWVEPTSFIP